ncbi:MAG TPA: hypothetical protein VIL20_26165 [Sandaracinaceae bacterium]
MATAENEELRIEKARVGLGFKLREAQARCDQVAPRVGRGAKVEEVLAAALRAAPGPRGYRMREEPAVHGPARAAGEVWA